MDTYGKIIEPGTIRFERLLPGPIERVWAYLTESEKRGRWLASGKTELWEGGNVELNFNNEGLSPHDDPTPEKYKEQEEGARFSGRVTACNPPNLLSHTWEDEESGLETEVTYELTPKDDKVLLVLTQRNLGDDRDMLIGVAAGWHTHLGILLDRLNGRTPDGFWSVHGRMEAEYEQRLDLG